MSGTALMVAGAPFGSPDLAHGLSLAYCLAAAVTFLGVLAVLSRR